MLNRLLLLVLGLIFLSACTKAPQNENVLAAKGGGDAEGIHGGDPLDLKLRSIRNQLGLAANGIVNSQRLNTIGQPLFTCNDFPVRSLCDAMNAPQNQRELARQFILRNGNTMKGLIAGSAISLIPSKTTQSQTNPDGSIRSVVAWTKLNDNGGADIFFHESAINLKDLELLALLAHELSHVLYDSQYGRITDNQVIAGFVSESGSGRYFLDLVAAELALYTYESFLKSDPDSLGGLGKGFLEKAEVMKHGGPFNQQSDYTDVDGDGKLDLIYIGAQNDVWYSRYNGIKFDLPQQITSFGGSYDPGHFYYPSLNGDRRGDILYRNGREFTGCTSNGSAFVDCKKVLDLPVPLDGGEILFGDFNGDLRSDIVFRDSQNMVRVYLYDGVSYQPLTSFNLPGTYGESKLAVAEVARDSDNIRRDDLMFEDADHAFYLHRSTGLGFASPVWAMQHGGPGLAQYADFNGDGLSDLIYVGGDNRIWLNFSNGQNLIVVTLAAEVGNDSPQSRRFFYKDFNGDGKSDILYERVDGNITTFEVLYSKGTGFTTKARAFQLSYATSANQVKVEDIDNDGRFDIVSQSADSWFTLWLSVEGR